MFVMSLTDNDLVILVDGWNHPSIGDCEKIHYLPAYNKSFIPFLNWALQFEYAKGTTVLHHNSKTQVHESFNWIDTIDMFSPQHYKNLKKDIFDFDHVFICGFHLQSCVTLIANTVWKKLSLKYTKEQILEKMGIVLNLSLPWPNCLHNHQVHKDINPKKFNYYMWRSNTNYTSFSIHQ